MDSPAPAAGTGRPAAAAFTVVLLATFGAFFVASRLKAEPPELQDVRRHTYFSPNGDGHRDRQPISFRVDLSERAAVDVVDADGARVRRLADGVRLEPGRTVRVSWDGKDDDGLDSPDGVYRVRVILRADGRTIIAPKPFWLDTRPPSPAVVVPAARRVVSPGEEVRFRVRGGGSSSRPRFRVLRTDVSPVRTVRTWTGRRGAYSHVWDGRTDSGAVAGPGTYLIAVTSRDKARNAGTGPTLPPTPGAVGGRPGVTVRALAVQPPVRPVGVGDLAAFRVDARGRSYSWTIRRLGTGRAVAANRRPKRGTTLVVRAPEGPSGVYLLEVRSHGARAAVPFAVQAERRAAPLVVLPTITWLGRSPLDDTRTNDGLPDVFAYGSVVGYPRLFAYPGGLPAGLAEDIAPLLVWLDREKIRYDVTTDLALSLSEDPRASYRRGVLLAGAPEWVSRGLARRLRRFVEDGGRVAVFGPGALRGGVSVGDQRLARPTPPGPTDAFGARLGAVREVARGLDGAPAPLTVLDEQPGVGLLEGFAGQLGGFGRVEELVSPGPRGEVAVAVGSALTDQELAEAEADNATPRPERPALSATRHGKGLVIRVGLPGWVSRLEARDPAVVQITYNIVDLLRGARARARSA